MPSLLKIRATLADALEVLGYDTIRWMPPCLTYQPIKIAEKVDTTYNTASGWHDA
jgi:hypothetical protein